MSHNSIEPSPITLSHVAHRVITAYNTDANDSWVPFSLPVFDSIFFTLHLPTRWKQASLQPGGNFATFGPLPSADNSPGHFQILIAAPWARQALWSTALSYNLETGVTCGILRSHHGFIDANGKNSYHVEKNEMFDRIGAIRRQAAHPLVVPIVLLEMHRGYIHVRRIQVEAKIVDLERRSEAFKLLSKDPNLLEDNDNNRWNLEELKQLSKDANRYSEQVIHLQTLMRWNMPDSASS